MKCVVVEKASITNCSQGFILPDPVKGAKAWVVISVLSSIILLIVLCENSCVTERCRWKICIGLIKLGKKGSFWSMNILLLVTFGYYVYVIVHMDGDKWISILILTWFLATPLVAYRLNYLYPAPCLCPWWCGLCSRCVNCCSVVYWLTLLMYCIESGYMFLAVTLDAATEVTPLINGKSSNEAVELNGLVVTLLGIRVAFNGRLLLFFWNKIFHGHKDLFSEPNRLLTQPVVRVMQCPQQPDDERRQPGPRQGPEE